MLHGGPVNTAVRPDRSAMRNEIESSLQTLIGLPFWDAGRAADLEWFQFGKPKTITDFKGENKTVGEYALHVQCAWRIHDATGIIVASRDRYEPADEVEDSENFEWDRPGANLCDWKMMQFLARTTGVGQIVTQVEADDLGGLCILLSADVAIEVFPDSSAADEYSEDWRFSNQRQKLNIW
jgi:hypothetical protein